MRQTKVPGLPNIVVVVVVVAAVAVVVVAAAAVVAQSCCCRRCRRHRRCCFRCHARSTPSSVWQDPDLCWLCVQSIIGGNVSGIKQDMAVLSEWNRVRPHSRAGHRAHLLVRRSVQHVGVKALFKTDFLWRLRTRWRELAGWACRLDCAGGCPIVICVFKEVPRDQMQQVRRYSRLCQASCVSRSTRRGLQCSSSCSPYLFKRVALHGDLPSPVLVGLTSRRVDAREVDGAVHDISPMHTHISCRKRRFHGHDTQEGRPFRRGRSRSRKHLLAVDVHRDVAASFVGLEHHPCEAQRAGTRHP